jgi:hypothetical protein
MPLIARRQAVHSPDLSAERHDVRGVADDLERGRSVQTVHDDRERAVLVYAYEPTGVG